MDLAILALHELYTASDNIIIGDGSGLSIANIGSFSLSSLLTPLLFSNVLHVPTMSKNLIYVSALCANNPLNVLFFKSFFQVQDHHTGVTRVHGKHRDGVYYWLKFVPLHPFALALSSSAQSSLSSISMWYSRLEHPSFPKFLKFLSVLHIFFPKEHLCSFSCTSCNINKRH